MTPTPRSRSILLLAALLAALALAGCGSSSGNGKAQDTGTSSLPGSGKPPVRLGTKNFTEEYVLGQLYKQALEAKGFRVVLKNDIGASEITDRALTSGSIDMYPEYTGVIVSEIAHEKRLAKSPEETYRRAKAFQARRGFVVLDKTPGQDVLANAVRRAFARKYKLKSTADLKRIGPFTYGGPSENFTRFQGAVGMRKVYGIHNLRYVPLAIEDRYTGLDRGKVDMIGAFTTDAELASGRYAVLSDPEGIFGYQNIVPVVSRKVLAAEGPEFAKTLNAVSAKLTNAELRKLNAGVELKNRQPATVAREFLQRNGLL
jgi:osmoprotectant transport system substrate-binding protein